MHVRRFVRGNKHDGNEKNGCVVYIFKFERIVSCCESRTTVRLLTTVYWWVLPFLGGQRLLFRKISRKGLRLNQNHWDQTSALIWKLLASLTGEFNDALWNTF